MAGAQGNSLGLKINRPCIIVIAIAGMERVVFKGVASNLVTYLTDIAKMSNSKAAKTVNVWCGLTSIMPLLVAPLADCLFRDRYSIIIASSMLYVAGLLVLTSTTLDWKTKGASSSTLFFCLCLISVGQGGYNPSLQAFGADQLGEDRDLPSSVKDTDNTQKGRGLFFTIWYYGVCTGSLLGILIMPYIQDTWGWGLGFAIPSVVMATSVIFFSWGSDLYICNHAEKGEYSFLQRAARALRDAVTRGFRFRMPLPNTDHKIHASELELNDITKLNYGNTKEPEEYSEKRLSEKTKVVLRLLPLWATLLIFAVIFQQPPTFFTKQGRTMKRNVGSRFEIPPATLQGAITISIIPLMPLYNSLLVPLMSSITKDEKGITVMQRIGVGMFLSTIAMVIAALVEEKRLENTTTMGSDTTTLSIFWLLPQCVLLGVSDIFTVIGMQEFFYSEVSSSMKTMGLAICTSVFGVGSFVSALLISLIELFTGSDVGQGKHGWFSDDMRQARIDKYYWLLASLSALSLLLYVTLCKFYRTTNE
ncbi:hypothetical protein Droror1_Dr00016928 [Drosera rotundifolia]